MENIITAASLHLLAVYNCNAYGAGTYGTCSSTASSSGGLLANTGYSVLIPLALGAALVTAAVILLLKQWKRRRSASASRTHS